MRRFLLSLALLIVPVVTCAHGDSPSFERQVGPYLIDIGYDRIGFRPGEEVKFDFDLYRTDAEAPAFEPFETVLFEVAKDGQIIESREIENERDFIPSTTYAFPTDGDHVVHVAYRRGEEIVAQADFEAPVGAHNGEAGRALNAFTYVAAALLAITAIVVGVRSFRSRPKA